jgi:hypothetical protein
MWWFASTSDIQRVEDKLDLIIDTLDDLMQAVGDEERLIIAVRRLKMRTDAMKAAIASATKKPSRGRSDV